MGGVPARRPGAGQGLAGASVPALRRPGTKRAAPRVGVPELRGRRVFPGDDRQLGLLRRWLGSLLPPCPARDDVMCVASELGANAIRHSHGRVGLEQEVTGT